MGYTHYLSNKRAFTEKEWQVFVFRAREILAKHAAILANGSGETGSAPRFESDSVAFNGIGDNAHETCLIARESTDFDFCKTAQKPYDVAVVEIYKLTRKILGKKGVKLSSDGGNEVFR